MNKKLYCNKCNKEFKDIDCLNSNEREEVLTNLKNEGVPSFVCSDCINKEMEEQNYNFTDEEVEYIIYIFEKYMLEEDIAKGIVDKIVSNLN